jgi:hypothetical protein
MRQRVSRAIEQVASERVEYREATTAYAVLAWEWPVRPRAPLRAMVYRVSKPREVEKDPIGDDRQDG